MNIQQREGIDKAAFAGHNTFVRRLGDFWGKGAFNMIDFTSAALRKLLALLTLTGALTQSAPADLSPVRDAQFPWYAALTQTDARFDSQVYLGENALITLETHDKPDERLSSPYILVDLYLPDVHSLRAWYADDPAAPQRGLTEIAPAARAISAAFAVNGDFYPAQGVTAVRNGTVINSCVSSYDLCVLSDDGTLHTYRAHELPTQEAVNAALKNAWQAWSFGPVLLNSDGSAIPDFSGRIIEYLTRSHPRTAIGYYGPGHYCLLSVSGYRSDMPGVSLEEMSRFFASLGCRCAYNLDGGLSTHLWFHGRERGYPSEARELADLIYVEDLSLRGSGS